MNKLKQKERKIADCYNNCICPECKEPLDYSGNLGPFCRNTNCKVLDNCIIKCPEEYYKNKFWDKQAKKHKNTVHAGNFDPQEEKLENNLLQNLIQKDKKILEIGCGNGRTLLKLAENNKECSFYGIDFSKEMIKNANIKKDMLKIENISFYQRNIINNNVIRLFNFRFDKIITKRLLINLKEKDKLRALGNIYSLLENNGSYIMIECFKEPLIKINNIRIKLDLEEIKINWFNEYMNQDLFKKIDSMFNIKEKKEIDFESLYYFISRIFNAYPSNKTINYSSDLNKLAIKLNILEPNIINGFSPQICYILNKR